MSLPTSPHPFWPTVSDHEQRVRSAVFSPDGTRVATSSEDGTVRIWDATTGKEVARQVPYPNDLPPDGAIFSPDGAQVLVTSSQLRIANLWDLKSGKVTQLDAHSAPILSAAFSPDGAWLVTASWDRTARVWDARTGSGIAVLKGHADRVISVGFSPDSARVITASEDQSAGIWDTVTGTEIEAVSWKGEPVRFAARFAAFSPDGTRMILLSEGNTARVVKLSWPLKGDAFAIACSRLGNIDLAEVREHYGLGEIAPICGDHAPLPVAASKLTAPPDLYLLSYEAFPGAG